MTTYGKSRWYGFYIGDPDNQHLLKFCDSLLPYPKGRYKEEEIIIHPDINDITLSILEHKFEKDEIYYSEDYEEKLKEYHKEPDKSSSPPTDDRSTKLYAPYYLSINGKDADDSLIKAVSRKRHPIYKGSLYEPDPKKFNSYIEMIKYSYGKPSQFKIIRTETNEDNVTVFCSIYRGKRNERGLEFILQKDSGKWKVLSSKYTWAN